MNTLRIFRSLGLLISLQAVVATETRACHYCNCLTSASTNGGTLLVCPSGDGPTLADIGAVIEVTVLEFDGYPVVGMPAEDFWIASQTLSVALCGGFRSSKADGPTDANGKTTISGSVAAGGLFYNDAYVIASGWPVQGSSPCDSPLPLVLVSPDINGDLVIDQVDLDVFVPLYLAGAYDPRADMNGDGDITLADLALFAAHFGHRCDE